MGWLGSISGMEAIPSVPYGIPWCCLGNRDAGKSSSPQSRWVLTTEPDVGGADSCTACWEVLLGRGHRELGQATLKQGKLMATEDQTPSLRRESHMSPSQAGPRQPGRSCGHLGSVHSQRKQQKQKAKSPATFIRKEDQGPQPTS